MKLPIAFLLLLTAIAGAAAGWFASRRFPAPASDPDASANGERRILFYQSSMHPWVRSDRPGKCTICGMPLTPVFEGESGRSVGGGIVTLSSNGVSILGVESHAIHRGPLQRTLRVAGVIDDDDSKHRLVSAWVGGRLEELHVRYVGAEVTAGEPLARFYSPMLLEAERQFLALGPGTADPPAQAEHGLMADRVLLRDAATRRLRQLGLTDSQISALPDKDPTNHFTEILSPVGGTVINRFAYAGQYVMEGEKLFEIGDFSTMWFKFDAYERDLPWIEVGQKVQVSTPSAPGRKLEAPIRFIDPNLDPMTRTAKVRVELPNPWVGEGSARHRLLRHRLFAEANVSVIAPDCLLVPRTAVLSPDAKPVVYLDLGGGAYEQRRLELGRIGDRDFEVLSGLDPGDRVVVSGNLMIDAQAQLNQAVLEADHASTHTNSAPPSAPPQAGATNTHPETHP